MEQDTRTLGRIALEVSGTEAPSGRAGDGKELEDLETDVLVGEGEAEPEQLKAIGDELRDELRGYIRRLLEFQVTLPRADLILMHADGGLLKFEDPEIYNLLQDAAGASRSEAVERLIGANTPDRVQALTYLLEQLETDLPADERSAVLVLVGEVAEMLDVGEVQPFKYALRRVWDGLAVEQATIARSPSAAAGFIRAFVGQEREELQGALGEWARELPTAVVASVERFNADSGDEEFLASADALLAAVALGAIEKPDIVAGLLRRADALGDADFVLFPNALDAAFTIPEPESAAASARRTSTADATDAAQATADYEADSERARVAFGVLTAGPFRDDGSVRRLLRRVLADLRGLNGWPLDVHDELVLGAGSAKTGDQRNQEVLEAIATRPEDASARWIGRLDADLAVDSSALQKAFEAVIHRGSVRTDEIAQTNAVKNARALCRMRPTPDALAIEPAVQAAQGLGGTTDWAVARVETAFELLAIVESLDPENSSVHDLQLSVALAAYDGVDSTGQDPLLAAIAALPAPVRARLALEFDWSSNDLATSVVVRCQAGLGVDPADLVGAASVIARFPSDAGIVGAWLETGPSFAEVERVRSSLPPAAVSSADLSVWANAVDEAQRALMWRELLSEGDPERAAAAAGEELPDDTLEPEMTALLAATSAPQREEILRPFLAVPSSSRVYRRAIVAVAPVLASAGAQQDLTTLATLLERRPAVSPQERTRIRALLEGMVSKNPSTLSRQRVANLIELNFLNRRGLGSVWDKVFGPRTH